MEEQKNTNYLMLAVIAVGLFFGGKYGYEWYMVNKIFDNVIKSKYDTTKLIDYEVHNNVYYIRYSNKYSVKTIEDAVSLSKNYKEYSVETCLMIYHKPSSHMRINCSKK